MSVYSPAWPLERDVWSAEDATDIKLSLNSDLWVADLLHAALKELPLVPGERLVVADNFNLCESFDWSRKPCGNLEYLTRLTSLGLVDALRHSQGALTPTFKGPRHSAVANQLDYIFVTEAMTAILKFCGVGAAKKIIGKLSDHLPVVADLR